MDICQLAAGAELHLPVLVLTPCSPQVTPMPSRGTGEVCGTQPPRSRCGSIELMPAYGHPVVLL